MSNEQFKEQIARLASKAIPIRALWDNHPEGLQIGIYIVFRDGTPVYVGITSKGLKARLSTHKKSWPHSLLGASLRIDDSGFFACVLDETFKRVVPAYNSEPELIRALRPEFNRINMKPDEYYIRLSREERRILHGIKRKVQKTLTKEQMRQAYIKAHKELFD